MDGHTVSGFITDNFYWLFLAALFLNLFQRKHMKTGEKKRFATLFIALAFFAFFVGSGALVQFGLSDLFLIPLIGLIALVIWRFRDRIFPFTFKCVNCGARLDSKRMLFHDNNLCENCDTPEEDGLKTEEKEEEEKAEEKTE